MVAWGIPSFPSEPPLRLFPVLLLVATLALVSPAHAQPRDEAPDAMPTGPTTSSVAEELTTETVEEKPPEKKPEPKKEKKPVKKAEPKKEKKPAPRPEKKPEVAKEEQKAKEPEAKKPVTAAGKEPVIVINPCTGEVSEELVAPQIKTKTIQPGKETKCLTPRQCDALCRVGEAFGEGGGAPYLSPRGDVVFSTESFTGFDDCVEACGPKCK